MVRAEPETEYSNEASKGRRAKAAALAVALAFLSFLVNSGLAIMLGEPGAGTRYLGEAGYQVFLSSLWLWEVLLLLVPLVAIFLLVVSMHDALQESRFSIAFWVTLHLVNLWALGPFLYIVVTDWLT